MEKPKTIGEATLEIVNLLTPFEQKDVHKIIKAAVTLLSQDETTPLLSPQQSVSSPDGISGVDGLPDSARRWVNQNGLDLDQIQDLFHFDGENVEVIAPEIPGKSRKTQVLNACLLMGVRGLLGTGDAAFEDKEARAFCQKNGCYDPTNHSTYLKGTKGLLIGGKKTGWKLTNPGLKQAAELIKSLLPSE